MITSLKFGLHVFTLRLIRYEISKCLLQDYRSGKELGVCFVVHLKLLNNAEILKTTFEDARFKSKNLIDFVHQEKITRRVNLLICTRKIYF